jgi:hypothetical protein
LLTLALALRNDGARIHHQSTRGSPISSYVGDVCLFRRIARPSGIFCCWRPNAVNFNHAGTPVLQALLRNNFGVVGFDPLHQSIKIGKRMHVQVDQIQEATIEKVFQFFCVKGLQLCPRDAKKSCQ